MGPHRVELIFYAVRSSAGIISEFSRVNYNSSFFSLLLVESSEILFIKESP